jgi:hypothetical protein
VSLPFSPTTFEENMIRAENNEGQFATFAIEKDFDDGESKVAKHIFAILAMVKKNRKSKLFWRVSNGDEIPSKNLKENLNFECGFNLFA